MWLGCGLLPYLVLCGLIFLKGSKGGVVFCVCGVNSVVVNLNDDDELVDVEKRSCSESLCRAEEFLLVTLSLNPERDAETVRREGPLGEEGFQRVLDSLLSRGLVDMQSGGDSGLVWRVTDLGVVRLFEVANGAKARVLEAEVGGEASESLRRQRRVTESALKQARVLFQ
jgi:hypothetical protein